jgi:hypothetical protein
MRDKRRKSTTPPGSEAPVVEVPELPERWSAGRKTDLVLRLLRGEALDAVSRESQVPAHELESWKRVFLASRAAWGCGSAGSRRSASSRSPGPRSAN